MTDAFEVTGSRVTHDGMLLSVHVDDVAMPDGTRRPREVVRRPDAVAVVALTDDDEVVLVRQYRHAVGAHELELPAGLLDVEGEPPRAAALRELAEEVGLGADRVDELTTFANSAGWTTETTTLFLARGLHPARPDDDFTAEAEEAEMDVLRVPLADAVAWVRSGRVRDAKTVIGLLWVAGSAGDGD